ncbi:MAG: serine/threonine-protein phosphatase [Acidobacteria bacterium]|nr:serine/threonine-protein phosphatase [Acidobacteriota bacterium]
MRTEVIFLGGLEVLLVARPAGTGGGGDIYCVHSCGHGALAKFVLLDLTGRGQARDAVARTVHALLHRQTDETRPAQLLDYLNQRYNDLALPAIYATLISAVCEPGRSEFRFANAGQPRPLHWSAKQHGWTTVTPAEESDCGLPLGVEDAACYTEESIVLGVGDILFLSSDGLSDTRDQIDKFLEPEGVLRFLEGSTTEVRPGFTLVELAAAFLRRFEEFHGVKRFEDDITLLWARRLPTNGIPGALPDRT